MTFLLFYPRTHDIWPGSEPVCRRRVPKSMEDPMALNLARVRIIDFETSSDAQPVMTAGGEVVWSDVRIDYVLAGLNPTVTIRVPVPWDASESAESRKSKTLRCARQLIDHACQALGAPAPEPDRSSPATMVDYV